ncbi:MAG: MBL fold metallo-hydrolase [Thermoplasmatota archaeon]
MNNGIQCQFLGGCSEVGSLSMVLECNGLRLLFEYGMTPSKPPTYPLPPPTVDLILLTHAHLDHSGMIPWLCGRNDYQIISTKLTSELSSLLHKDSVKIAKSEGYAPLFSNSDIRETEHSYIHVEPSENTTIGDNCEVKFHSAGHIPGSLMYELKTDKTLLFSGDINVIDTNLIKAAKPVNCDVLFLETTYGGREHPKRAELEKQFVDKIDEVVRRGGIAVIPAFAVSRSQELIMVLKNEGFNVWFDGMGRKVSKVFLKYPKHLRSASEFKKALNKINFIHSDQGRKKALKSEVIITSSGMMDGGPVLHYMNSLKNDKKSAVLLTGYQVEGTNSRLLVDKGQLDFYGVKEKVECEVGYFDFSAHAGHSELINFAKQCKPEKIVLFHGDNRETLVEPLQEIAEIHIPQTKEIVSL